MSKGDADKLSSYIIARGQIKAKLTKFRTFLNDTDNSNKITEIKLRMGKIESIWNEFDNIQNAIESIDDKLEHIEYRDSFVDMYFELMAQAEELVKRTSKKVQNDNLGESNKNEICPVVKLRPIEVPIFTGKFEEWATFQDMFSSLIHLNKSLTNIEKFYYLRNSLSGEANSLVQNLETSSVNYEAAWAMLQDRYNNKRMLIQCHTKHIYDLESISKESATKLRFFTNALKMHIQALQALDHDPYQWGALLLHIICTKIDIYTMRQWESEIPKNEVPSIKLIMEFLEKRCQVLESVENAKMLTGRQTEVNHMLNKNIKTGVTRKSIATFLTTSKMKCYMCQQSHPIYKCTSLLALDVESRLKIINDLKLCKNCLKNNHSTDKCTARKCFKCQQSHNTLLHSDKMASNEKTKENTNASTSTTHVVSAHTASAKLAGQVLLATAVIKIFNGQRHMYCRALLDSGSQSNFITAHMTNVLGLRCSKINIPVCGINESKNIIKYKVTASIQSVNNAYTTTIELLVIPKITESLPSVHVCDVQVPDDITLADPEFNHPGPIDILIGADTYWELMGTRNFKSKIQGPYFQETVLGWIVVGKTSESHRFNSYNTCLLAIQNENGVSLEDKIEKFWKIEEFTTKQLLTSEEKSCQEHFEKHVTRNSDGRFIVKLPFKENKSQLGNSYKSALRRFLSLEQRLMRESHIHIYNQYKQFMVEYESLGHMERVGEEGTTDSSLNNCFYLPHTFVLNEGSRTTKLRVVFDGSATSSSNLSLNDVLMRGPKIQPDLFDIAVRFRTYRYAFSADITKMYRQIIVDKHDCNYQLIFWRSSINEKISVYQLRTVTYGTVPASYLAVKCLDRVSNDTKNEKVKQIIKNDFCVDDCLTGADTLSEAISLRDELISTLRKGGFELGKWTSNNEALYPESNDENVCTLSIDKQNLKTLGLYWEPKNDYYTYVVKISNISGPVTKRSVLSGIACLFDPLGLVSPVIVIAKIFMQNLWREKLDWDEPLSVHDHTQWKNYNQQLCEIESLIIPRWIGSDNGKQIQLHGFSDASTKAYGACLYIRTINKDGIVDTNLICSRSRIAPVKSVSIPRLELCAAVLLARLIEAIGTTLRIHILQRFLWTDSTVTLSWIASDAQKWKTFVANRVGEIHSLTSRSEWRHVSSCDNPADVISRGCSPEELKVNNMWWYGPAWLREDIGQWPNTCIENIEKMNGAEVEEKQISLGIFAAVTYDIEMINKYSSLTKLYRITAFILRFKNNCLAKNKNQIKNTKKILSSDELCTASKTIVKLVQKVYFHAELKNLKSNREVSQKSKIYKLKPYIDEDGIIRVGGRLANSTCINHDQRFPILIPSETNFSALIFSHEHKKLLHAGPQATLAAVRLKYWPINGRRTVRKVTHSCVICFKARPQNVSPNMGNLPKLRINTPTRCFENCGVDYAGPFLIKTSQRRNSVTQKAYVCVFVCFATKAVHLELVCDLTTTAFISALTRFISRRGICKNIYSDNATCFVGANNKLYELNQLMISEDHKTSLHVFTNENEINWHFIPPRSPHFGGLWEAAVRSVKHHLNRNLSSEKLMYDEFYTILVQIEACLNSRPLTPLSSDPDDLSVLTPGHFIIGDSLISLPQPDFSNNKQGLLLRWQNVQRITQQIWKRWSSEYLGQLQGRSKWVQSCGPSIKLGSMVLIKETNLPPMQWRLGRVTSVHPGNDGVIRVATVHTAKGPMKRAVRLLCPLPIIDNNESNAN